MSHTSGPWYVHKDQSFRGYEISSRGCGGREVCRINSRRSGAKRGMGVRFFPHPDDEHNANLLAAAPDLLAAAKLALEKCPFPVGAMAAKRALEEAIAKAEGAQ